MIGADQIKVNFEEFQKLTKEYFGNSSRYPHIGSIIDVWKERFMMAPASNKDWYHNAFPGGYLDHVLRVNKIANQLYKLYDFHGSPINFLLEELNFATMFGQLGKLGVEGGEYFIKNDSDWHVKNMGMVYKFNPNLAAMKIYDRTFFLLQQAGIPLTQNEYLAIRAQEGLFDESNKFYFYSGQKETRFQTALPMIVSQAIQTAQEIEYQMWSQGKSVVQQESKPANASKADKTIRKAKAINAENNPNFNEKTKSIIDSFFD